MLREIENQLSRGGAGDELALNLLQQGRLLIANYRYPEAIRVLSQAIDYENNSMTRGLVNIELAKANYETGKFDVALAILRESVYDEETGEIRRASRLLELTGALRIMANIYRHSGNFSLCKKSVICKAQDLTRTGNRPASFMRKAWM